MMPSTYPLPRLTRKFANERYTVDAQSNDATPAVLNSFTWSMLCIGPTIEVMLDEVSDTSDDAFDICQSVVDAVLGMFLDPLIESSLARVGAAEHDIAIGRTARIDTEQSAIWEQNAIRIADGL